MSAGSVHGPVVVLYGRPDCPLCDEARDALLALRAEGKRFELRERNIEEDEGLLREHLERIPVIEVAGEVVCELGCEGAAVRAAITSGHVR